MTLNNFGQRVIVLNINKNIIIIHNTSYSLKFTVCNIAIFDTMSDVL